MNNNKIDCNAKSLSASFQASAVLPLLIASLTACSVNDAGQGSPAVPVSNDTSLTCSDFGSLHITGVTITRSEEVPAGESAPAHCLAQGIIDSEIQFDLRLPEDWNGKLYMAGGGGFVDSVPGLVFVGPALSRGYATTGTNTGHVGNGLDASWAYENFERQINFGYRAIHLTAQTAQEITRRYYNATIGHSYFQGCSRGGGQAMMEAQRYPTDFDGIIAIAPAYDWVRFPAVFAWNNQQLFSDGDDTTPLVTAAEYGQVRQAVVASCDAIDGIEDGIITDPRLCQFDPATALPDFSPAQIAALEAIHAGPSNSKGRIFPGFPITLNATGWNTWIGGGNNQFGPSTQNLHDAFASGVYRYFVYGDPTYDIHDFDFETDMLDMKRTGELLNATATDLRLFKASGGKLLMAVGWADPAITPYSTIQYHDNVLATMGGADQVDSFYRLFMMPGVDHCAGGVGPDQVDWLTVLEQWVEEGVAPQRIPASRRDTQGNVDLVRPLCPHPQVAVYDGSGDPGAQTSFSCEVPEL
jgi:feruloyl esterase